MWLQSRGSSFFLLVAGISSLVLAGLSAQSGSNAQSKVVFSRDILPILSDKCFKCHGPDAESRQAAMRLDTAQGAFADRGGRYPVVPHKPEDSLIVKRINDPDSPMPPESSGKSLTKQEKDLIARWISEGAEYGRLWSFEPLPKSVTVPKPNSKWPREDIDRFILDRLNREKLTPNPPATKERWLRRGNPGPHRAPAFRRGGRRLLEGWDKYRL